jgi:hypothetical protein
MTMRKQSDTERALIVCGLRGACVVVATDGPWIANDVENISDGAEDIGLDALPSEPGVYLWEGIGESVAHESLTAREVETEYTGSLRNVHPDELPALLEMRPPGGRETHRVICPDCGEVDVVVNAYEGDTPIGGVCPGCEEQLHFFPGEGG